MKFPRIFSRRPRAKAVALVDHWDALEVQRVEHRHAGHRIGAQLGYHDLAFLTDFDWLARRIVRKLPETAWQDELQFAREEDADRWRAINRLPDNDDGATLTAAVWARTFGAAIVIRGFDRSGDADTPLPEGLTANRWPDWLEVVAAPDYQVLTEDINQDKTNARRYGLPEYYRIVGDHRFNGLRIHHSRVVHFVGPTASRKEHMRDQWAGTHLSALDPVLKMLKDYNLAWSSIGKMLRQASIPVWTLDGLIKGLAHDAEELKARMQLQQDMIAVDGVVMLDAAGNESYERKAVSFADLPAMLQQITLKIAAAADCPVTELFGRIVSGLGDTGEVEQASWHSRVEAYRTRTLAPRIDQILGTSVPWEWAPLKTPTLQEETEAWVKWWTMGGVTEEQTTARAAQLLVTGS